MIKRGKKRVVKLDIQCLNSVIEGLRILNNFTDEQVRSFCGNSKQEAIENMILGLERSINNSINPVDSDNNA